MSLIELLNTARTMCRADRIRLVQCLVDDLAREEGLASIGEGNAFPVATPLHAFDAAATMLAALDKANTAT